MGVVFGYTADQVQCTGAEEFLADCSHTPDSDCRPSVEAAGVICTLETNITNKVRRQKRSAIAAIGAATSAVETGANIIGSAIEYFDKKEKEHQEYLKERPDAVDLSSAGVEIKLDNEKGYFDVGGEFQNGGMDVKIQDIEKPAKESQSGGDSFAYPAGIGPLLMNGCFGQGYGPGDPCYASKRLSEKCLDQIEAANYIGVGFDATGGYTHVGRRKSLIQRVCANKGTYQGEDVPDNMNVFGIYNTGCQGKTFESLEARSKYQREQSKLGENKDFLNYGSSSKTEIDASINLWTQSGNLKHKHDSESNKDTNTETSEEGRGQAATSRSSSKSKIFNFECRIRRYEIFLDEVTPEQLSEAFLQDYMNLPQRFFDFRNKAPQKYTRFLERWGTHYIKSASFGGKFSIVRKSTISGTETEDEWSASMQNSVSSMFESRKSSSSSDSSASASLIGGYQASIEVDTEGSQNQESSGTASGNSETKTNAAKEAKQFSMDDLIVEGGSQRVASILSDKDRSGFKAEFKAWLDSIPAYPKGYDFQFGELSELVDMNFQSLLGDFVPCWEIPNHYIAVDEENKETIKYDVQTKDEEGNEKIETRNCNFRNISDFNYQMELRRLSLKRAINVYAKNKGRSSTDLVVPAGEPDCERKIIGLDKISYEQLTDGRDFLVNFDMLLPIGKKIRQTQVMSISFKASTKSEGGNIDGTVGRWVVNSGTKTSAGQLGSKVAIDMSAKKVILMGISFTYGSDDTGNTLEWTKADCETNLGKFQNLKGNY